MTPEERAEALVGEIERWARVDHPFGGMHQHVVDAFARDLRAAENEALERAADDADWCAEDADATGDSARSMAYRSIARRIRSLKHPEPKP